MPRSEPQHVAPVNQHLLQGRTAAGLGCVPEPLTELDALDDLLLAPDPIVGLETLLDNGALESLLPEVHAIVDFHSTCPVHHKDLWSHTLEVMERTRADADLRWAVLMHDVGKLDTRALDGHGRVTFHRHEERGAVMMREVGARLEMAAERVERIAFIIERHGWVNAYTPKWTDRAVRRLIRESGPFLDDLLDFSRSDYSTRRQARKRRIAATLEHLAERIDRLHREDAEVVRFPRGLGSALATALDIPPGPTLGEAIERLRSRVRVGTLPPNATLEELVRAAKTSD